MDKKTLVIIPTYNERENITRLIPAVLSLHETLSELEEQRKKLHPNDGLLPELQRDDISVLIVDDNSPDGTADLVKSLMKEDDRIHLLEREAKLGLGTAYCAGFKYALEKGFDYIFEMDADFSHDYTEIPNFLREIQEYDLVIGSRYIKGVNVVNWPINRLLLSYFANKYTKMVTGMKIQDATGGFKCFRRKVLESIDLDAIKSNGYAFQIEMNYKVYKKGFKVKEIPIIFIDRQAGQSKMSNKIVREAVLMVWRLRFKSIFGKL